MYDYSCISLKWLLQYTPLTNAKLYVISSVNINFIYLYIIAAMFIASGFFHALNSLWHHRFAKGRF